MRSPAIARSLVVPLAVVAATATNLRFELRAPKIHLAMYCTNPGISDDSGCLAQWIDAGIHEPWKILYADAGTYVYTTPLPVYSRMKLECASGKTTFQNRGSGGVFLMATTHVSDVRVDGCAFDVNGNPAQFLAVIDINPQTDHLPSTKIIVTNNRFYDGMHPGVPSDSQRQYILLINCHDCRVERNRLSEGGRIKVGAPGEHLRIFDNEVEDANDNAITVADVNDAVSQDIAISRNVVRRPKEIGIYFGMDGDALARPGMTANDIRVEDNRVEGDWGSACILGRLPDHSRTIRVLRNRCVKTGPAKQGSAGVRIKRSDDAVLPATDIKIERNTLVGTSPSLPALDAGIFFSGAHDNVSVSRNEIANVGMRAMLFEGVVTHARINANTMGTAEIQVVGSIQGQVQSYSLAGAGSVTP